MRSKNLRQGQTWSVDVLLGSAIFILALIIFFYAMSSFAERRTIKTLETEGKIISMRISSVNINDTANPLVFVVGEKVDNELLKKVANTTYKDLRNRLGVKYDFCIFFKDENGHLINLSEVTGKPGIGIGSPNFTVSGHPCGSP